MDCYCQLYLPKQKEIGSLIPFIAKKLGYSEQLDQSFFSIQYRLSNLPISDTLNKSGVCDNDELILLHPELINQTPF